MSDNAILAFLYTMDGMVTAGMLMIVGLWNEGSRLNLHNNNGNKILFPWTDWNDI